MNHIYKIKNDRNSIFNVIMLSNIGQKILLMMACFENFYNYTVYVK